MPPIQIDKILSDPLLLVSAVLLIVSPILFLIALIKYVRTPKGELFAIPHNEMDSPIPTPKGFEEPAEEHRMEPAERREESPVSPLEPMPGSAAAHGPEFETGPRSIATPTPPAPVPPRARREESAAEKTVVMPPGVAEMQSEMEIALTQLRLLNKRVANLEQELARLRGSSGQNPPPVV